MHDVPINRLQHVTVLSGCHNCVSDHALTVAAILLCLSVLQMFHRRWVIFHSIRPSVQFLVFAGFLSCYQDLCLHPSAATFYWPSLCRKKIIAAKNLPRQNVAIHNLAIKKIIRVHCPSDFYLTFEFDAVNIRSEIQVQLYQEIRQP